jgi:hypothetical protein
VAEKDWSGRWALAPHLLKATQSGNFAKYPSGTIASLIFDILRR